MSGAARVHAIEALEHLKQHLCVFREDAGEALGAAEWELRRTTDWVRGQLESWRGEARRRRDEVARAKNELDRRKLQRVAGKPPDCTEQEKALAEARRRLDEAEQKIDNCRHWVIQWQRTVDENIGPLRRFSDFVQTELPKAAALLDRKSAALDAYVRLGPPPAPAGSPQPSDQSSVRPEAGPVIEPGGEPAGPSASEAPAAPADEGRQP